MKYNATGRVDQKTGTIDIYERYDFDDEHESMQWGLSEMFECQIRMRMETNEKIIREGLIKLGWTPPKDSFDNPEFSVE